MWQKSRNRAGMRGRGPGKLCCLSCLVERTCPPPCSLQAAAEPVAVGSVHTPLHSAWRPPARGLTFPEVLSHSASCYSLWQVRLHQSGRQQTWAEARRRGLFHTSHWSSLLEVPRSQGVYRRLGEVSITLLALHAAPGASQVWGVVPRQSGGLVDGGEGHRSDSSAVSAVILPKTKLHGWFSWVQWSKVTQVLCPKVKKRSLIHLSFCTKCSRNTPWRSPGSSAHSACQPQIYWRV